MKEGFRGWVDRKIAALVLTVSLTGAVSPDVSANNPNNTESVDGGNVNTSIKDENPDRHIDALNNLDVDTSTLFASAETNETKESIKTSTRKVIVQIGEKFCLVSDPDVSGETNVLKENDTCPEIINNRTMVPLRFISEALGATVDWNGEDKSITIKKDNKEIGMQIGNNKMKVSNDDSDNVKEFILDSPPVVNKDNRTLVPVRAIAEAFGIEVQWDENTNSAFIGYSKTEMNNLLNNGNVETEISADAIDLNSSYQASRFMVGGEYMNVAEEGPFAIKDKQSGAVVVFSDNDFLNVDKTISLIERSKCNAEELHQKYLNKSIVNNIKDKLNSNDCVYVLNGEAYVFNNENLKEGNKTLIKYDAYGNPTTITNDKASGFYYSGFAFDKSGIHIFDGTKVTHNLNTQTQQCDELSTPEFVGTLQQRTIHNLEAAYNAKWPDGSNTNPLGLDYQDILEYKNTGSDANCKSFKLIQVSDNLGFIYITGGRCGLKDENTLKTIKTVLQKCNEIDPAISQKWIENGLVFFTREESACDFFTREDRKNWISALLLTEYGGSIYFNEDNPNISKKNQYLFLQVITGESYAFHFQSHVLNQKAIIDGVVYEDVEVYKNVEWEKFLKIYFPGEWDWFNLEKKTNK